MAEKEPEDWLFPNAETDKTEMHNKGVAFAQRYLVFAGATSDPRARELLEHWTQAVRVKRIAPGATVQEYASHNAMREFVEGIHQQVGLALANVQSVARRP